MNLFFVIKIIRIKDKIKDKEKNEIIIEKRKEEEIEMK